MRQRSVAIVGYGTAGQALALLLGRAGWQVDVFEQAPRPGPVGAGFLLQPSGLQVLWQMGLLERVHEHGAMIERLHGTTPCGRTVMDIRYADLDRRLYGLGLQRGALFQILHRACAGLCRLHAGLRVVAVDAARGVLVDAQGQQHGAYDLVVAADGASSQLRAQAGPARRDAAYPWGALWCLVPAADWPEANVLAQRYVAARKMVGMLPVGTRPDDDTPMLSFFWSLPATGFDDWEASGMAAWQAALQEVWPACAQRLGGITRCDQLARASYRDAVVSAWSHQRLVLAGDSAHAMSPQLGQGVNMALLDAWTLAGCLAFAPTQDQALADYARQRRAHVSIYQFWSRWLTPLFQSDHDRMAAARDLLFGPLGRVPGGRSHMLRVLTGTQQGWLGKVALQAGFIDALQAQAGNRPA